MLLLVLLLVSMVVIVVVVVVLVVVVAVVVVAVVAVSNRLNRRNSCRRQMENDWLNTKDGEKTEEEEERISLEGRNERRTEKMRGWKETKKNGRGREGK